MRDAGQGVMGPWLGLLEEDVLAEEWILPECSQSPCVTESAHTHKASKRHQTGQRRHATSVRITNRLRRFGDTILCACAWGPCDAHTSS